MQEQKVVWIKPMDIEKGVDEDKMKNIKHETTLITFQGKNQEVYNSA